MSPSFETKVLARGDQSQQSESINFAELEVFSVKDRTPLTAVAIHSAAKPQILMMKPRVKVAHENLFLDPFMTILG